MAVDAEGARRISFLARSKPVPEGFSEDKRSVYWIDRWPYLKNGNGTTDFAVTPRNDELANAKFYSLYVPHRATPMWPVSAGARNASTSQRLQDLAREKTVHGDYRYHRSVYTEVPQTALSAGATTRIVYLSEPKPHKVWHDSQDTTAEGEFGEPITLVTPNARRGLCTPRVETLAESKETHPNYLRERTVQWPVADTAMNAQATQRVQQLARPKSGRLRKDDYDPYRVTVGARLARASPRVTELSLPIPRKIRQKRGA